MYVGKLVEDWRVFPLELKDTGLVDFPSQQATAGADQMQLIKASPHDPAFYR